MQFLDASKIRFEMFWSIFEIRCLLCTLLFGILQHLQCKYNTASIRAKLCFADARTGAVSPAYTVDAAEGKDWTGLPPPNVGECDTSLFRQLASSCLCIWLILFMQCGLTVYATCCNPFYLRFISMFVSCLYSGQNLNCIYRTFSLCATAKQGALCSASGASAADASADLGLPESALSLD